MIPLKVFCSFYGPYAHAEWEIPDGCVGILGRNETSEGASSNGAGKTKLLELIPVALFGPRGSWSELVSAGSDETCVVGLEFEHAGDEFGVVRTFNPAGRGKTSLDFEQLKDGERVSLTRESQSETQRLIESTLGISEATFSHAVYARQGAQHFADPSLSPRDRKRVLTDALGLDVWDDLCEAVRQDKRVLENTVASVARQIEVEQAELESLPHETEMAGTLRVARRLAVEDLDECTAVLKGCVDAETDSRLRDVALAELRGAQDRVKMLGDRERVISGARAELDEIVRRTPLLQEEADRIERLDELALAVRKFEETSEAIRAADSAIEALMGDLETFDQAETKTCDRCGSVLSDPTKMRDRYIQEISDVTAARDALMEGNAAPDGMLTLESDRRESLAAQRELFSMEARARQLREVVEEADSIESDLAEAVAAAEILQIQADDLTEQALQSVSLDEAKNALDQASDKVRALDISIARTEERLKRLTKLAESHAQATKALEEYKTRNELLLALERAYGRDGIPALIMESAAIPQIEAEAERVLQALGVPFRVELQTQRETKTTGSLKDTLEVVVHEPGGARPYETYSGGERTRIELALRIGLGRLLAHRRGADLGVLILDEMPFLDTVGQLALAAVLRGLQSEFPKIIVVSHDPTLADALGQFVTVVRDSSGAATLVENAS